MKNVIISTSRMVKSIMLLAMLLLTYSAWGQQNWLPNHPRLLFTGAETFEVKELIKNEPLAGELALYLKAEADSIAEAPQLPYEMDKYGNMLWTSRAYVYRLGTLSLAYRIYGEDKYLKAANDAILWVCNFPDWDPKHYLDTAEMTTAVAIAYDWLLPNFHRLQNSWSKRVSTKMRFTGCCANTKKEDRAVGQSAKPTGTWYVTPVWYWAHWL